MGFGCKEDDNFKLVAEGVSDSLDVWAIVSRDWTGQ